jgi:hypothetical protein
MTTHHNADLMLPVHCGVSQIENQQLTAEKENISEDNEQLRSMVEGLRGQLNESRHSAAEAQKLAALSTADANLAR